METFGAALRRHRERRGLTQEAAAALLDVKRATFTQWETNRHLPSVSRALVLDEALNAEGALVAALESARASQPVRIHPAEPPPAPQSSGPTLYRLMKDARRALLDQICRDENGRALGWRHNLVPSDEPPSTLSTIYGIGALALLGGPDPDTHAVVDRIMQIGVQDDGRITGWKARVQREPRLEATAAALDSLWRAGVRLDVAEVIRIVEDLLDETSRQRPFILTLALRPLLRMAPHSALVRELVRALLDCRQDFDGVLLWPEKQLDREQPMLAASVAHTARAVEVLRNAPDGLAGEAVAQAEEWLAAQTELGGVTEIVRRALSDGDVEELSFNHFTSALVVRALAGAERPDRIAIERAMAVVWERHDAVRHLWAWGNGDPSVWLLEDSIAAVQDATLALANVPDHR